MRVGCAAFYSQAMYQSFASGLNIYQESGPPVDNTRPDFTAKIRELCLKLVCVYLSSGPLQEDTIVLGTGNIGLKQRDFVVSSK